MASKLTEADKSEITRQSDVRSKPLRNNFTNFFNKINEIIDEIAAIAIGTTNAETTAARPYHTSLKNRLDSIGSGNFNYIKSGGVVSINAGDSQKVDIIETQAKVNGIDVKAVAATSGTIAFTSANTRYDIVAIKSDSTFEVITGAESADPVLPAVATTQKALWVLIIGTASVALGWDARSQGCYYHHDGAYKFNWEIQDAVDDITVGDIFVAAGKYYEEVDLTGKSDITLRFENGAKLYRIANTAYAIKSINTVGNEETGIKVIGADLYGNSKAGSLELLKFDYTDEFTILNCQFDGNGSSTATYKNFVIDNSDNLLLFGNIMMNPHSTSNVTNSTYNQIVGNRIAFVEDKITFNNDTNIYRDSAGTLKTDDNFAVAGEYQIFPGNAFLAIADTEVSATLVGPTKKKEIQIACFGTFRITFDLKHSSGNANATGRIYKNGSPFGTAQSTTSTTYVTFSEDLVFSTGDLIQLYIGESGIDTAYARNFRVKVKSAPIGTVQLD
jgi:hypothetical protein